MSSFLIALGMLLFVAPTTILPGASVVIWMDHECWSYLTSLESLCLFETHSPLAPASESAR